MEFFRYILSVILLASAFECMYGAAEENPKLIHHVPKEKSYSMDIEEVHKCIACNSDNKPREDFLSCLRLLSDENKQLAKQCCEHIYDEDFCNNAYAGKIDFNRMCSDPSKAVQTNGCFWKSTDKTAADVLLYKQCRQKIIYGFCTTIPKL